MEIIPRNVKIKVNKCSGSEVWGGMGGVSTKVWNSRK